MMSRCRSKEKHDLDKLNLKLDVTKKLDLDKLSKHIPRARLIVVGFLVFMNKYYLFWYLCDVLYIWWITKLYFSRIWFVGLLTRDSRVVDRKKQEKVTNGSNINHISFSGWQFLLGIFAILNNLIKFFDPWLHHMFGSKHINDRRRFVLWLIHPFQIVTSSCFLVILTSYNECYIRDMLDPF